MQAAQQFDYQFRIHTFGAPFSGRTCLLHQITDGVFLGDVSVFRNMDFRFKSIYIDDKSVRLQMWEFFLGDKYIEFKEDRLRRADAILMVYDITNQDSFDFATKWIAETRKNPPPLTPILLLGNKIDLAEKRVIDTEKGLALAKMYDAEFYETSAKTGEGLKELVWELVNKLIKKQDAKQQEAVKLTLESAQNSKCY